jgi:hypothetical protein
MKTIQDGNYREQQSLNEINSYSIISQATDLFSTFSGPLHSSSDQVCELILPNRDLHSEPISRNDKRESRVDGDA